MTKINLMYPKLKVLAQMTKLVILAQTQRLKNKKSLKLRRRKEVDSVLVYQRRKRKKAQRKSSNL
jgi:hypothetical protein